jgi:hypothetical protein
MTTLRPPSTVMRLDRMGSFFPTRLSFMRSLIRRLNAEGAKVTCPVWEINAEGYGRAVYSVGLGGRVYSLIAFATPLADEDRTDRVIAEAWDSTYVLFDGVPTTADLDRLEGEAPRQEAGRYTAKELSLSRANKSQRLFAHVVEKLRAGEQPDECMVDRIGYLMRTTAVYGNGKFGFADRELIADRPEMSGSFQAEMLTVWLIRGFTLDLVEHVAGGAKLSPTIRRHFGIGNSTGLGMAPFLVTHPLLLNNWMVARETALSRVLATTPDAGRIALFRAVMDRASAHLYAWNVDDERQMPRILLLRDEMVELLRLANGDDVADLWRRLYDWSADKSAEMQELLVSLLIEPYGDLVDELTEWMTAPERSRFDPTMTVGGLKAMLADQFGWSAEVDMAEKEAQRRFWYVSEEKLEPRIGDRYNVDGADKEQPLDTARQAQAMAVDLQGADVAVTLAMWLLEHPQHRMIAKRIQALTDYPYGEIQENLIAADCLPIDMLRCKLSFFGATKFDPKSDLWTRVNLFQGAPGFDEVNAPDADDWSFPVLECRT